MASSRTSFDRSTMFTCLLDVDPGMGEAQPARGGVKL